MFEDETISAGLPRALASARTHGGSSKGSVVEREVVELFDGLRGPLLRYLFSLGLPASDAEEIIQETFLALFLHLERGKPRHHLRAWLFRVAHNLGLKQRQATQRGRQSLIDNDAVTDEGAFIDHAPNPEDQLAWNERRVSLSKVWQALPAQDRRCLALRAEGLTYREIAQVLEISLGSVSLSLARSLARFARAEER